MNKLTMKQSTKSLTQCSKRDVIGLINLRKASSLDMLPSILNLSNVLRTSESGGILARGLWSRSRITPGFCWASRHSTFHFSRQGAGRNRRVGDRTLIKSRNPKRRRKSVRRQRILGSALVDCRERSGALVKWLGRDSRRRG